MTKPRIALSGMMTVNEKGEATSSKSVLAMKALLESQGAEVSIINPLDAPPERAVNFDGIVFMGNNNDIDPARYGEAPNEKTKVETDRKNYKSDSDYELGRARAAYEDKAMSVALRNHVPVFGVCGGLQRMNVVLGGGLIQHVDGQSQTEGPSTPVEEVKIIPNTKLAAIAGQNVMWRPSQSNEQGAVTPEVSQTAINSFHHQVVDPLRLGLGLAESALGSSGTIEAVESTVAGQYAVGVQWHPEFLPDSPLSKKLVENFVGAAKEKAQTRGQSAVKVAATQQAI